MKSKILLALFLLFPILSFANENLFPQESHWVNQHGSQLHLIANNEGDLTGTFITNVGNGVGVPRDVVGTTNQYGVSFTANHEEAGSITSWTGLINENQTEITALWLLVRGQEIKWDATNIGQDVFVRVGE